MYGYQPYGSAPYGVAQAQAGTAPVSTVTSVTVTPSTIAIAGGGTVDFDWVIAGTNSPSQLATVTTSLGSISSAGVLTAPAATTSAQTGTITVISAQDPTKSGTATFTIAAVQAGDTTGPVMQGALSFTKTSTTTTVTVPAQTDPSGIGEYFFAKDGGAFESNGTSRTKTYTGLAPLTPHLYEVTVTDALGNPSSNSLSVTVVTDAAGADPSLVEKSIVVTLNKQGFIGVRPNIGGINWSWSDSRGEITSFGSGLSTNSAGQVTVPIRTRLLSDATGKISLDNYDGGNILTYFSTSAWVRVP